MEFYAIVNIIRKRHLNDLPYFPLAYEVIVYIAPLSVRLHPHFLQTIEYLDYGAKSADAVGQKPQGHLHDFTN